MVKTGQKKTKELILEAAAELFSKRGFHGVSVREIAKKCGIRESSLYNHYTSKNELLDNILTEMDAALKDRLSISKDMEEWIDSVPPVMILQKRFTQFLEFWSQPALKRAWAIVCIEQFSNPRAATIILEEGVRQIEHLKKLFDLMQVRKVIKDQDTAYLAKKYYYTLFAMLMEYNLRLAIGEGTDAIMHDMFIFIRDFGHHLVA